MFNKNQLEQTIENLEKEEIEAPLGQVTSQTYSELFAAYLYKGDLANARFLWKRIPLVTKTGNEELDRMWTIHKALWQNDLVAFFKNITYNWSSTVSAPMLELKDKIFSETISLIGLAYSSIFEDRLAELIQQTPEQVIETCKSLDWTIEDGPYPKLVLPKRAPEPVVDPVDAEAQLAMLTDFVSFLEN